MPKLRFDRDRAALHLDHALRDREAQSGAALLARVRIIDLLKFAKDLVLILGRDAGAGIAHGQNELPVLGPSADRDFALIGEFESVADRFISTCDSRRASP